MRCQADRVSRGRYTLGKRTHLGANRVLADQKFGFRPRICAVEHCAAWLNPTDCLGRPIKYINVANDEINLTYDNRDNKKSIIDPTGKPLNFNYSETNRLLQLSYSEDAVKNYEYNSAGRVVKAIGVDGKKLYLHMIVLGGLLAKVFICQLTAPPLQR